MTSISRLRRLLWKGRFVLTAALWLSGTLVACGPASDGTDTETAAAASTGRLSTLLGTLRRANAAAELDSKTTRGACKALLDELSTLSKSGDEAALAKNFKELFGHALPADVSAKQWLAALKAAIGEGAVGAGPEALGRAIVADHTVVAMLENLDDMAAVLRSQGAKDTGVYELLLAAVWRTERPLDAAQIQRLDLPERMLSRPTDSGLRELGEGAGLGTNAMDRVASLVDDVADVRRAPYTTAGKMLRFIETNTHAALVFGADGAEGPLASLAKKAGGDSAGGVAAFMAQMSESAAGMRKDSGFGATLLRKTKGFREMELRAERTQRSLLRIFGEEQYVALALGEPPTELIAALGTNVKPLARASDVFASLADDFESSYELVIDTLSHSRHGNKHLASAVQTVEDAKRLASGSEGQYLPKYHADAERRALEETGVLTGIRDPHGPGTDYFWYRAAQEVGAGEDGELTRWIRVEVTSGLEVHSHPRPYAQLPNRVRAAARRLGLGS